MTAHRLARIIPLRHLTAYPGAGTLDMTFLLPPSEDRTRRVWAMVPQSTPVFAIDDTVMTAEAVCAGPPRWIDYGVCELPTGFAQLRVRGMTPGECADACLLIAADTAFSPGGRTLDDAARALWGMARCDAGTTTIRPCRVEVATPVQFTVTYTAGPRGLPAGLRTR